MAGISSGLVHMGLRPPPPCKSRDAGVGQDCKMPGAEAVRECTAHATPAPARLAREMQPSAVMRVAIPCWRGRVSPVFDTAGTLLLVDIENGRESRREQGTLRRNGPFARAGEFLRYGAGTLICGAISEPLERALRLAGVEVTGFVCGPAEEVLSAYLAGELSRPAFRMPGAHRCRRRRGEGSLQCQGRRPGPVGPFGNAGPGAGAGNANSSERK